MKKTIALILIIILGILSGCSPAASNNTEARESDNGTRIFVDSAGRNVEIPTIITSVAPTGPLSQAFLYMACPDLMVGVSGDFPAAARGFIPDEFFELPAFGRFFGVNVSLNLEALIAAGPDVIVDIGEAKANIADDLDGLQRQIGIPVIFIEATLDTLDSAFLMLGELTGDTARAERLSKYVGNAVALADNVRNSLREEDKVRVYIALGEDGLSTNARDSFHADVLLRVGAKNVADVEASDLGGGSEVSFEQLLLWNPQVILVESALLFEALSMDPIWRQIEAVQTGRVYMIPTIPYNFITNPPAANRVLGIKWLGSLLYPELFKIDIEEEVRFFFREFYSIDLTDEQFRKVMTNAM